nr:hypothetical protein 11 [bacterium]
MKPTDNPANKWQKQRDNAAEIGREIDERKNGEIIELRED